MELTIRFLTLILSLSITSFAARGSLQVSDNGGGYPGPDWAPTKAFLKMYDFSFNGKDSPKIYSGFSAGGNHSYDAAVNNPTSTLAATPCSWKHNPIHNGGKDLPIFTQTFDGDFGSYDVSLAQEANSKGHRESVAWDRGKGHSFNDPDLVYLFWIECIRSRYASGSQMSNPKREDAWLGDMSRESWDSECPYIAPYADYQRDKSKAAWLPTRTFAFAWRAFTIGQGRTRRASINIQSPKKTDRWENWPSYNEGADIPIRAVGTIAGAAKIAFYYGDNLIGVLKPSPFGIYDIVWKKAEAGIHGLNVIAYDSENKAIATSLLNLVIVNGSVTIKPVDNSGIENPGSVSILRWSDSNKSLSFIDNSSNFSGILSSRYLPNGRLQKNSLSVGLER